MEIAKPQKIIIVRAFSYRGRGVSEKQEHVYFIESDPRGDLIGTAGRTGKQLFYSQTRCVRYILTGDTGSAQVMLAEYTAVSYAKL